jgi:hypothetical protein
MPLVVLSLAVGAFPSAQRLSPAVTGTGLIVGRVIDGMTGAAVTGVLVTLTGPAGSPPTVMTDSRGRFMFTNLPAGRITIRAEKTGYLSGGIGRTRADGQPQSLDLTDAELLTDLPIRMWRFGSIEGTVVDEKGEPVVGTSVQVFMRTWRGGHPSFARFAGDSVTDDRGIYHFGDARPGDYVVAVGSRIDSFPVAFVEADSAARQDPAARQARTAELSAKRSNVMGTSPGSSSLELDGYRITSADVREAPLRAIGSRLWIYPYTFHPAVRTPDAAPLVHLDPAEQRKGVDIRLTLSPTARLAGIARGPDGPIANLALRLRFAARGETTWSLGNVAETVTDASGAFTFFGVPAGQYVIAATTNATAAGPALWATQPVTTTDRDVADLAVVLRPSLTVSGRIDFQGTSPRPAAAQFRALALALDPADGSTTRLALNIDPDGTFRNVTLPPGPYYVRVIGTTAPLGGRSAAAGLPWTQKSAMFEGKDVSDVPLVLDRDAEGIVVTFTDRPASLTGIVRNVQGAPDSEASVLLFPVKPSMWINTGGALRPRRLQSLRADRAGTFTTSGLPAGDYFVVALPDAVTSAWQDPKFLERASRLAEKVRIDEGQAARIELRTQRW